MVDRMDLMPKHPHGISFLFPKSGKIKTGRKEKDEDDRNKQCYFGFFHRFLRLK